MAKTNYATWHIDAREFSENLSDREKLLFFARYAILAPSGHNTQPWRFSFDGQALLVRADYSRRLPYSGVKANEPFVSLGACLQTLQLAAKGFGHVLDIRYDLRDDLIAKVTLGSKTAADPSLLEAITHRVSNRHPYEKDNLSVKLLQDLTATDLRQASSYPLSKRDDIDFIAKKTEESTYRIFGDKEFRAELSKWVRNNLTKQHDGMPGFVQGIPTPPSLLAKHIIRRINISKDQAKKDTNRILASADLLLVLAKDSNPEALLDSGRLYAQICVLAQQRGIASTGLGTAIIEPIAREEIMKKYGLKGHPIAIIRLGKTVKSARHTPRWPLARVTE